MQTKFHYITIVFFTILLFTYGCEEEINLDSKQYEELLVVEGAITNEPGPYTIKLSLSSKLESPKYKPYSGCTVTIYEKSGPSEILEEVEPGVYKTSENGIKGKAGNYYSLDIQTPDGKTYATDFSKMEAPVEISSIEYQLEKKERKNNVKDLVGYQFYISTGTAQKPKSYFLWELEETYEYTADYHLHSSMYHGEREFIKDRDSLYRCWKTNNITQIFTANTINLKKPKVTNHPLNYTSTRSKRLQHKYSLLVKQFSVDKKTYTYWKNMKEQITSDNFLSAKQPFQLDGNIYNPENMKEPVLGYFNVASVSKKRIYAEYTGKLNITKCEVLYDYLGVRQISNHRRVFWAEDSEGRTGLVQKNCIDCRENGGKLEKPDFWED